MWENTAAPRGLGCCKHALGEAMKSDERRAAASMRRDLSLVLATTVAVALGSMYFEVSEAVQAWARHWEHYQFDEYPGILLVLVTGMTWFAWRRMREAEAEVLRREAVEHALAAALSNNRRLMNTHVQVQEDERRRIARELHDELGQHLNAIKVDAVTIREAERLAPDSRRAVLSIIEVTDHLHAIVRNMIRRLRPAGLDELGLPSAIENYLESMRGRLPELRVDLAIAGNFDDLAEPVNITLYRVIQEGLTNVVRHANASCVEICLNRTGVPAQLGSEITLTISDNGTGHPARQAAGGLGLIGMRERIEALGGRFEVSSGALCGFLVSAWLPVVLES